MKPLFIAITLGALLNLIACSQTSKDVPANVKAAFTQKFSGATNTKWEYEKDNEWEAEFKMDGKEYSASFDNNGGWLETEYEINNDAIPDAVKTAIENDFAGYKIAESEISETTEGKVYELELKKSGEKIVASFDMNGKLVKKEKPEDKGDKDDDEDEEDKD
ncbi:MAG: PepSY-like domain-containing protein [Bacteroidota bacterium]